MTAGIIKSSVPLVIMVSYLSGCMHVPEQGRGISYVNAVAIARGEFARLGYDMESMELKSVSKHYVPWNSWLPRKSKSQYIQDRQQKLEGKKYWAVSFGKMAKPGHNIKGGSTCVFIDSTTGEILTTYRGK
ncbi:MAG: hypothetical protein NT045_05765 [Candidatus Aureabacteria bacterium]|nr:hypothetical protein [Candidatus Auribacterota bacterium]